MRFAMRLGWLLLLGWCVAAPAAVRPITVFAAASLRESLDKVDQAWEAQGHDKVVVSYAASSALAKQIEQGAPADVFISADDEWMDYLRDRKLIEPASRFVLVRNALVLIAPVTSPLKSIDPADRRAMLAALGSGRLAVAETSTVPAGKYARQALEKLGLWNAVAARLAQGENVRAALEYVARGDTPLGIVYLTDARAEPRVRIVDKFPEATHPRIVYPVVRMKRGANPAGARFADYLGSAEARGIFEHFGFRGL